MKILHLSASIIPSSEANSVQVISMCAAMGRLGHEVTLYARSSGKENESLCDIYGIEPLPKIILNEWPKIRGLGGIFYARSVVKDIRKTIQKNDLIYARDAYTLWFARNLVSAPCVYEAHMPPRNFLHKFILRDIFSSKSFRGLVVVSARLRDYYLDSFAGVLAENKILVAPNGADYPQGAEFAAGNNSSPPKIGYFGSLQPHKGDKLIAQLALAFPSVEFHICGPVKSDSWFSRNQKPSNVIMHGVVSQRDISKVMHHCAILLAPYQGSKNKYIAHDDTYWGSPLKIFEYMALGRAIVASDVPAVVDILDNDSGAIICGQRDLECWKNAIKVLLMDSLDRRQRGVALSQLFKAKYERTARMRRIIDWAVSQG